MHPVAVIAIILGGAFVFWGGYEAVNTLYEWHHDRKEQREYEEYVRMHNEKNQSIPVTIYRNDESDNESDESDDEPLGIWKQKRDSLQSNELRQRRNNTKIGEPLPIYEFSEMERSISTRKSLLERENELLLKEEAELERSRHLIRSKGNNITGVIHDTTPEDDANPFSVDFFVQKSSPTLSANKSESSWDDLNEEKRSNSVESFESIRHNQL